MFTRALFCFITAIAVWLDRYESLRARLGLLLRIALGLLTFIALASWWSSQGAAPTTLMRPAITIHKLFPSYIGAKYSQQLRYDGIYDCSLAAIREREKPALLQIDEARNLSTGTLVKAETLLAAAEACRNRFTQERWLEFSEDVTWFKSAAGSEWTSLFRGHGITESPAWLAIARTLIPNRTVDHGTLRILLFIDILLLIAMWAIVALTFSRAQLATAAVFWGISGLAALGSGALLQHAWLLAIVAAIAALHAAQWRTAGILTAVSSSLALFPALAVLGVLITGLIQTRNRTPAKRVLGSFLVSSLVLFFISTAICGRNAWSDLYRHSRTQVEVGIENRIGLPHLLDTLVQCHVRGVRAPDGSCAPPQHRRSSASDLITYGAAGLVGALFLLWLRRTAKTAPITDVAILAFGFAPLMLGVSSPFYTVLLLFALLNEQLALKVALLALCLLVCVVERNVTTPHRFYQVLSILFTQFVLLVPTLYTSPSSERQENAHG